MSDAPIAVVATLRRKDGSELTHSCTFTADEWRRLDRFVTYARTLSTTTLLSTDARPLEFSLIADEDGVRFEGASLPNPDHFRALLLLMRPFVLKDEQTYFQRVVNILRLRLDHSAFRAYLDRQKEIFGGGRWQVFKAFSNGMLINSSEMLELWLNAYAYHRDEEKAALFESLHRDEPALAEHSEAVFVGMVLDQARAVIDIGNAIFALQRNAVIVPLAGDR